MREIPVSRTSSSRLNVVRPSSPLNAWAATPLCRLESDAGRAVERRARLADDCRARPLWPANVPLVARPTLLDARSVRVLDDVEACPDELRSDTVRAMPAQQATLAISRSPGLQGAPSVLLELREGIRYADSHSLTVFLSELHFVSTAVRIWARRCYTTARCTACARERALAMVKAFSRQASSPGLWVLDAGGEKGGAIASPLLRFPQRPTPHLTHRCGCGPRILCEAKRRHSTAILSFVNSWRDTTPALCFKTGQPWGAGLPSWPASSGCAPLRGPLAREGFSTTLFRSRRLPRALSVTSSGLGSTRRNVIVIYLVPHVSALCTNSPCNGLAQNKHAFCMGRWVL